MEKLLDSNQIFGATFATINKLRKFKNGGDALILYFSYLEQKELQNTRNTYSKSDFMIKKMGWGRDRFKNAKKVLLQTGLIEEIYRQDDAGKFCGSYIRVNFAINIDNYDCEEESSDELKIRGTENPSEGKQDTNTSNINKNTSNINKNALFYSVITDEQGEVMLENMIGLYSQATGKKVRTTPNLKETIKKFFDKWKFKHKKEFIDCWNIAIQNYYNDIKTRNQKSSYASHRFSFSDFLKQSNGFDKYLNQ